MIKKYGVLLFVIVPFLISSCGSEEDVADDDYCYIWEVSLGSLRREVNMLETLGKDTTIATSYTGTNYPMTINQRTLMIENMDSLLYGTQLRSVLVNISYAGSKLMYFTKIGADSIWLDYNSTDSMDLRNPLKLMLIANNGLSSRLYTLKLNVHSVEGDSLYWKKAGDAVPQLQGMSQHCAIIVQGCLAVLGKTANTISLVERTSEGVWNDSPTNLSFNADLQTVVKKGDSFFVSTAEGDIYTTEDGRNWQKLNIVQHPGLVLAGATSDYLYALMDGKLYRCYKDELDEWNFQSEALDESSMALPSSEVKTLLMQQANGNQRLVLVGNRAGEDNKTSDVWSKMWGKGTSESEAEWVYFNQTEDNKCTLPQLEYLNLIQYDGKCMAFGGASVAGKGTNKAMDVLYVSENYGISWNKNSELHLPTELKGVGGPISCVVDEDNVIWIIANGEVWRGKLNRLDFKRQ